MEIGVFIPIANNGWLISTTSPQYMPSFALNREVVQKAEAFGFDFALSMIKLRGYGGPSQFWDHALESFTLMAGLAAVTTRIQLLASVGVLTIPPALAARMAVTIDSIAPGRFGINIVSGWQKAEYDQMGLWPGSAHYQRRYEYCSEYVAIMRELWNTGRSDFRGEFFRMNDCRLGPLPQGPVKIVCAGQSERGMRFAAEYGDYAFIGSSGVNEPARVAPVAARLAAAAEHAGRDIGAFVLMMAIADESDEAAMGKWERYQAGADQEALAWWAEQAAADRNPDAYATAGRLKLSQENQRITQQGVLVGSYASVARMLDEVAAVPGVRGVMLTFDDFVTGMDNFARHIQPLMASRAHARAI